MNSVPSKWFIHFQAYPWLPGCIGAAIVDHLIETRSAATTASFESHGLQHQPLLVFYRTTYCTLS